MSTENLQSMPELAAKLHGLHEELVAATATSFYLADALNFLADNQAAQCEANPFHLLAEVVANQRDRLERIHCQLSPLSAQLTRARAA